MRVAAAGRRAGGRRAGAGDLEELRSRLKWRMADRAAVGRPEPVPRPNTRTCSPVHRGAITGVNGFSNFGDATYKGLDYELRWRTPVAGLVLRARSATPTSRSSIVSLPAVQAALPLFRPGSRLVNSIEHTSRVDVACSMTLSVSRGKGFGNVSYGRTGDRLQSSGLYADPYGLINATLGVREGHYEGGPDRRQPRRRARADVHRHHRAELRFADPLRAR